MIGWENKTLGDLMNIGRGASPRPIQNFITKGPGIPWVKIADATKSINKYIERTKEFIIEEGRRKTVYPGELIVSNSATPGIPKFMKIEACVHDGWLVFDEYKNIDTLYLYYFFLDYRRILAHSASGTVFKNLTTEIVRDVSINLPPLQEQKAIAKVLTAFDDKIELLQDQNKTLETMAQTIFKEWFGKYQIGDELPEGWREYELGDVCNLSAGGDKPKNSTSKSEGENIIPIYSNGIKNEGLYGFTNNASIFDESVTVSARGTIGYVCLRPIPYVPIVRLVSVIPDKNYLSAKFLFYFLKNNQILGTGTTQQQLTIPDFKLTRIIIPNSRLMDDFTKIINTFYIKIYSNKNQIQSLTKTRDTLLPKLMSGQVRVNNIKQTVDA